MADDLINSFMSGPDEQGRFGQFGGRWAGLPQMEPAPYSPFDPARYEDKP